MQAFITSWMAKKPVGLAWRSHYWFTTAVIGVGIAADLLIYSVLIPVLPFRLEHLGYRNVSSLVGYMLFAFSGGLVVSTIPIAWYSERYHSRKGPLNLGMLLMIGCQLMLIFSRKVWLMILARGIQGVGSSMIWVAGVALVCDMSPPEYLGRQLGSVMAGFSAGIVLGPAIGGALYDRFGWNGPLIFGAIALILDLIGRLLIVDRDSALKHGIDPRVIREQAESNSQTDAGPMPAQIESAADSEKGEHISAEPTSAPAEPMQLSLLAVIGKMFRSPRALTPIICSLVYGMVVTIEETTAPLHLYDVWGLNSTKVGLVFLAAAVPPLAASPLLGWLSDKYGIEWTLPLSLMISVPWWCLLIIEKWLALFIVMFAVQTTITASTAAPIMTELANAANTIEGVGYAHVYGAFNLIYGVGSAVGPLIGGQVYEHREDGWLIACIIGAALVSACSLATFCLSGEYPLLARMRGNGPKTAMSDGQTPPSVYGETLKR